MRESQIVTDQNGPRPSMAHSFVLSYHPLGPGDVRTIVVYWPATECMLQHRCLFLAHPYAYLVNQEA